MEKESTRPWGTYRILEETNLCKVKEIKVLPGKRLSYQRHQKRAEHWFILEGNGVVTINGVDSPISRGSTVDFGIGDLHRISNTGSEIITFIEVQTGTYFGEDDIERIEDDFGR